MAQTSHIYCLINVFDQLPPVSIIRLKFPVYGHPPSSTFGIGNPVPGGPRLSRVFLPTRWSPAFAIRCERLVTKGGWITALVGLDRPSLTPLLRRQSNSPNTNSKNVIHSTLNVKPRRGIRTHARRAQRISSPSP